MERLLTRELVANLGAIKGNGVPVTSVYLGLEDSSEGRRHIIAQFKDLVGRGTQRLIKGLSHDARASVKEDIERCEEFLENTRKVDVQGLAIFSSSKSGVFETVGVAVPFRPHLVISRRAAVAPLVAALDEFKRIAVCLVDRREARLYEYFMGRMDEVLAFVDEVPGRVRVGGWSGYEESRISRHIVEHEYGHLKNVAEALFEQFKLRGFDWLFLGARNEIRDEIEGVLHTYVRDRLKGYIEAGYRTPAKDVRQQTMELAAALKAAEMRRLVETLVAAAKSNGLAVLGLRRTLQAINASAVRQLVVRRDLACKGVACLPCGRLGLRSEKCPLCHKAMTQVDNIIDLAEEVAGAFGAEIRHVDGESALDDVEGIGAFLRFPLKK